jgi:hypothetical protein
MKALIYDGPSDVGEHGPRLADEIRHETEGLVRGGGSTHAELAAYAAEHGAGPGRVPVMPPRKE